jgi:serine palmitoyltransferase
VMREEVAGTTRLQMTTQVRRCINLGSYNYLGMSGETWKETCRQPVLEALKGMGSCGGGASLLQGGMTTLHAQVERAVAEFVGKEDAVVFNMGYGTNATTIPALLGKGSLIVSDSLNHTSIVNGARASGAIVRVYKHNDVDDLDQVLKQAIADGQPRTRLPWTKVMVMTEGIFSMEGEICNLPGVVQACKRYKAFLYVDEAHSIGALGKRGKGVCEQTGVDPADVDILMGTFTKSFGAMGGYIAASKQVCDFLRSTSTGCILSSSMSPVVCAQILASLRVITGQDGTSIGQEKLDAIKRNANYVRTRLQAMGCEVLGALFARLLGCLLGDVR